MSANHRANCGCMACYREVHDANEQERVWTIRNFTTPDTLIQNVVGPETLEEKVVPLAAFQAERERADRFEHLYQATNDAYAKQSRLVKHEQAAALAAEKKAERLQDEADEQYERAERYREALERLIGAVSVTSGPGDNPTLMPVSSHEIALARSALAPSQERCPHGCEDGWIVQPPSDFDRRHGESRRWHDPCPIHASSQEGKEPDALSAWEVVITFRVEAANEVEARERVDQVLDDLPDAADVGTLKAPSLPDLYIANRASHPVFFQRSSDS